MNQQEYDGQGGGLESLAELVHLWRQGTEKYSPEFLAATICADLGRRHRLVQTEVQENYSVAVVQVEGQIREAEEFLRSDPRLAECALADVYTKGLVEAIQDFVAAWATRRLADEELADEGFGLLCDYDSLHLILHSVAQAPLSSALRQRLRREQQTLRQAAGLAERNLLAFSAAAPMVNSYCLAWNVEEDSVLSQVARLGSREAEVLWKELNRALEPLPAATPECPDENRAALALRGQLSAGEQEAFDRHRKGCEHCRGLLDLLTAAFARLPAELPAALRNALPQELRKPGLWERLRRWFEDFVLEFPVSLQPAPVLLEAYADTRVSERLDELAHRRVLIDNETVQAVLFARGEHLFLSLFAEDPREIHSFAITDARTGVPLPAKEKPEGKGEILYCLGPVASLAGKTFEVSFRLRKQQYRRKVRVRGI